MKRSSHRNSKNEALRRIFKKSIQDTGRASVPAIVEQQETVEEIIITGGNDQINQCEEENDEIALEETREIVLEHAMSYEIEEDREIVMEAEEFPVLPNGDSSVEDDEGDIIMKDDNLSTEEGDDIDNGDDNSVMESEESVWIPDSEEEATNVLDEEEATGEFEEEATGEDDKENENANDSILSTIAETGDCVIPELQGKVFVQGTKGAQNLRRYDHCVYCSRHILNKNFSNHIMTYHGDKKHVIALHELKPGSAVRCKKIQLLRNEGNFVHNTAVLKDGGELFVVQRPATTLDASKQPQKYVACKDCHGFFMKEDIYRHSCPATVKSKDIIDSRDLTYSDRPHLSTFFKTLRSDEDAAVIRNDALLVAYIDTELLHKGAKTTPALSNQVRVLSKLIKQMRENEKMHDLDTKAILTPQMFPRLKDNILKLFNYVVQKETVISVESPSSFIKLVQTIVKVTQKLKAHYIMEGSEENIRMTDNFTSLVDSELKPLLTNANLALKSRKWGMPQELPQPSDIEALKNTIEKTLKETVTDKSTEREVKEATMAYLLLFNKRRASEVAKLKKEDWLTRDKWKQTALPEIEKLDDTEKVLVKSMNLVYVPGKGSKMVPILFPEDIKNVMDELVKATDKFVFQNSAGGFIRGNDALRNVSRKAGLKDSTVTSTKFRKLAATTLQLQNFTETEYRVLCKHLGHTLEVHERYYRMQDSMIELSKVAKMLVDNYNSRRRKRTESEEAKQTSISKETQQMNKNIEEGDIAVASEVEDETTTMEEAHEDKSDEAGDNRVQKKTVSKSKDRRKWTHQQTEYLRMRCAKFINQRRPIGKLEGERIKNEKKDLFKNRTWLDIKFKVHNETTKFWRHRK